jgi:hypothetical protein
MSVDLFALLPAVYRIRDAELAAVRPLLTPSEQAELAGLQAATSLSADEQARLDALLAKAARGPLQSLLSVIGEQFEALAYDLDRLYDDQFIETCAPWVIPYIGDLIGYQQIKGIAASVDDPRSEVAETISLRRRKGTILVIEQIARDVTGWGAHAVEFFQILGDTQYLKHIRRHNHYAPDLRDGPVGLYIESGFDRASHRIDVRSVAARRGRYNIRNIGVFLWSLGAYELAAAPLAAAPASAAGQAQCFRFSALGADAPLFHRAISQGAEIVTPAEPINVPDRLRRRALCEDLRKGVGARYYGAGESFILSLTADGAPINPYQLVVADLSGPDGSWANLPLSAPYLAAIDPELGRLALAAGVDASHLTATYHYGFNAEIGGGPYPRSSAFLVQDAGAVLPFPDTANPIRYTDLQSALAFAATKLEAVGKIAIEIAGNGAQQIASGLAVDLPAGATLELRGAEGARPTLLLDDELQISGDVSTTFALNGLVMAASATMTPGPATQALLHLPPLRPAPSGTSNQLESLQLTDCTLVPGWSLDSSGAPQQADAPVALIEPEGVAITIVRSIVGRLHVASLATASLSDSIVDATSTTGVAYFGVPTASGANLDFSSAPDGGALTLSGCTLVGKVHARELTLVSDCIFWGAVTPGDGWASALVADRRQAGCVRFSFLPVNAITPRKFECVLQASAMPQPLFFSLRYGDPAYLKLLTSTDDSIRRGADDGGEMGAFHLVQAPQRETDLKIRLQEYTPVGLEVGLIYQT